MTSEGDPRQRSGDFSNWRSRVPFESFEGTAMHLGIPKESWGDPEVQRFIGLVNRVSQLQHDLTVADSQNMLFRGSPERYLELNAGLKPTLADRYSSAELLMRVASEVLLQGFKDKIAHPDYIQAKLNAAIGGYGLSVEKTEK